MPPVGTVNIGPTLSRGSVKIFTSPVLVPTLVTISLSNGGITDTVTVTVTVNP